MIYKKKRAAQRPLKSGTLDVTRADAGEKPSPGLASGRWIDCVITSDWRTSLLAAHNRTCRSTQSITGNAINPRRGIGAFLPAKVSQFPIAEMFHRQLFRWAHFLRRNERHWINKIFPPTTQRPSPFLFDV